MQGFRLSEARVTVALPYLNHYLVELVEGGGPQLAIDISGSSSRSGSRGGQTWRPGSRILCCCANTRTADTRGRGGIYILGNTIPFPQNVSTDFVPQFISDNSPVDFITNPLYQILYAQNKVPLFLQDRSYGRPTDIVPGDYLLQNMLSGMLLFSDFMTRFGVSPQAYQEFYAESAGYRRVCREQFLETDSTSDVLVHRGSQSIGIQEFGRTAAETLGAISGAALKDGADSKNPSKLETVTEDPAGFFRYRHLYGGMAEGTWRSIAMPPTTPGYSFAGEPDPGLLSEVFRQDGIYRLRAAQEIRFERAGVILIPKRIQEPNIPDYDPTEPDEITLQQKIEAFGLASEDEYYALQPLLSRRFAAWDEQQQFYQGLRNDTGLWIFPTEEQIRTQVFGNSTPPSLPVMAEQSREYTLADLADMLSAAREIYPGRSIRLFKNSSVFLMSEDGGFSISDGFGGEIRMNRGQVTITSASDIIMAPGRDLLEVIGGNRISKARDRVELVSSRDAIMLKAETNMHLVSGGESGGALVLENRSETTSSLEVTPEDIKAGRPAGSGIVMRSRGAGILQYAKEYYIGPAAAGSGESKSGAPDSEMTFWLNAGRGAVNILAGSLLAQADNDLSIGIGTQATGVYMSGSLLSLVGESMDLVAAGISVSKGSGTVDKPYLNSKGLQSRSVRMPSSDPSVLIHGDLATKGVLAAKGQIQSEKSVVGNDGCNSQPLTGRSRLTVSIPTYVAQGAGLSLTEASAIAAMEVITQLGYATEYGQKIMGAAFPSSDSKVYRALDFQFMGYTWQGLLQNPAVWEENVLEHDIVGKTMPFPGMEVYTEKKDVLRYTDAEGNLVSVPFDEYPVNSNE